MKIKIKNNNNKNLILLLCFLIIALVGLLIWQKVHKEGFFAVEKLTSLDDIEAFIYINLENREDRKSQILGELGYYKKIKELENDYQEESLNIFDKENLKIKNSVFYFLHCF